MSIINKDEDWEQYVTEPKEIIKFIEKVIENDRSIIFAQNPPDVVSGFFTIYAKNSVLPSYNKYSFKVSSPKSIGEDEYPKIQLLTCQKNTTIPANRLIKLNDNLC